MKKPVLREAHANRIIVRAIEQIPHTELHVKIPFTNPFLVEFIEHLARIGFNAKRQEFRTDLFHPPAQYGQGSLF